MKVDLHCHTRFSPDSTTSPDVLVERAREADLDRVAVTDHGEIEGALRARSADPELVIVGEEIRCADRTEVIGLFLRERIPEGLPLEETVARIRDQGGVVYVPHPFAYLTRAGPRGLRAIWMADAVEGFNARAFWPAWNRRAVRAATRWGLPVGAGSDAHFPGEIGQAYTEMPAFLTADEFRENVPAAHPVGLAVSPPTVHLASAALKLTAPLRPSPGTSAQKETAGARVASVRDASSADLFLPGRSG